MEQEPLLHLLLETVGKARRISVHPETERGHRLSPVAQSTLCLLLEEGSMNQRTIAKKMNVTGQAVSELMKKFQEKGLILRESGEQNNENIISLTPLGRERGEELQRRHRKLAQTLFQNFTSEERENFAYLLEKMTLPEGDGDIWEDHRKHHKKGKHHPPSPTERSET